jgi:hypothetical protein
VASTREEEKMMAHLNTEFTYDTSAEEFSKMEILRGLGLGGNCLLTCYNKILIVCCANERDHR